jgi:hypothetical protein
MLARMPVAGLWRALALVALGLAAAPAAWAQQSSVLDRFDIGVGGYYATSDTTVSASVPQGFAAASINLEDDLGLGDRRVSPRVRADLRIGDHQSVSIDYYRYGRRHRFVAGRSINWRGDDYALGADIQSKLAFAFGSLAWRWWFGSEDNALALGFGASHYRVAASLRGSLRAGDHTRTIDEETGTSVWAPLLRVGWRHAFSPHWRLYFSAAGVFKSGGKLQGHIYNASLGAEWLPVERLGFALEYGINSIHVKQSNRHYRDSLDLELDGPSAFVYVRF